MELNSSQRMAFEQYAGCCRFVWNWALDQRQQYYAATGKSMSWTEQDAQLKHLKKQFSFLGEAPAQSLQQVVKDLDRTYKGFLRKVEAFRGSKRKASTIAFACRKASEWSATTSDYQRWAKLSFASLGNLKV